MNRIESYLSETKSAETPKQLLEAMAKLFEGPTPKERELLAIQIGSSFPSRFNLTQDEARSLGVMLEQWKRGESAATVGIHLLMIRVIMFGIGDYLNEQPHFGN
jgi:hypothetical protein